MGAPKPPPHSVASGLSLPPARISTAHPHPHPHLCSWKWRPARTPRGLPRTGGLKGVNGAEPPSLLSQLIRHRPGWGRGGAQGKKGSGEISVAHAGPGC